MVNDNAANMVRGLELRGCSYWLTHAAYVIEVSWSGHLASGADRFIISLTGMHYIQYGGNTFAWFKSDNIYDRELQASWLNKDSGLVLVADISLTMGSPAG